MVDGIVYICSADRIYALNAQSGEPLWINQFEPVTSPIMDNGVLYVGSSDEDNGHIYAIKKWI